MNLGDKLATIALLQKKYPQVTTADFPDILASAYDIAVRFSGDSSTKNAAILISSEGQITSLGVNGLPAGITPTPDRIERPGKYKYFVHAEVAAIVHAARTGMPTEGATMICPWAACVTCSSAIIASGLQTLVVHRGSFAHGRTIWNQEITDGQIVLREAQVQIHEIDLPAHREVHGFFNGAMIRLSGG